MPDNMKWSWSCTRTESCTHTYKEKKKISEIVCIALEMQRLRLNKIQVFLRVGSSVYSFGPRSSCTPSRSEARACCHFCNSLPSCSPRSFMFLHQDLWQGHWLTSAVPCVHAVRRPHVFPNKDCVTGVVWPLQFPTSMQSRTIIFPIKNQGKGIVPSPQLLFAAVFWKWNETSVGISSSPQPHHRHGLCAKFAASGLDISLTFQGSNFLDGCWKPVLVAVGILI